MLAIPKGAHEQQQHSQQNQGDPEHGDAMPDGY
jgi:hypothetical protein